MACVCARAMSRSALFWATSALCERLQSHLAASAMPSNFFCVCSNVAWTDLSCVACSACRWYSDTGLACARAAYAGPEYLGD